VTQYSSPTHALLAGGFESAEYSGYCAKCVRLEAEVACRTWLRPQNLDQAVNRPATRPRATSTFSLNRIAPHQPHSRT